MYFLLSYLLFFCMCLSVCMSLCVCAYVCVYVCVCICVCVCVCVCVHASVSMLSMCEGQGWFFPFTFKQVLEVELRSPDLPVKIFYTLNNVADSSLNS